MLETQNQIIERFAQFAEVKTLQTIQYKKQKFPIYQIALGSTDPEASALALVGGVHGLERIGSEVVLSYMQTVSELYQWDEGFRERLKTSRMVFLPVLNPVGVSNFTRSNGNGVDLMRNAPLDGKPLGGPIYRGHRLSPKIPWYRGEEGHLELETLSLFQMVKEQLFPSKFALALDVHSGFGAKDRLWFPFGHSHEPFPQIAEALRLKLLLDQTYPHHFYAIEPVSTQYTIHGDLWDDLYLQHQKTSAGTQQTFLPLTLEMGSWAWLKKNPLQIFQKLGVFNPIKPHRHHRILRRHLNLFDFLHRSVLYHDKWWPKDPAQKTQLHKTALKLWYKDL